MPKLRGGQVSSIKSLKASVKKGGGEGYLDRIPADGSLTVRFLTEPDGWFEFFEHYDDIRKFFPCTDDCPGCREPDNNPSKRYLANVVDTADNKVLALVLPKNLAGSLLKKYEKYGTLMDRDYELTREGQGFQTEYDAIPEPPSRMNVRRFETKDLWALLEAQIPSDGEDDDDDEADDDEPRRPRRGPGSAEKHTRTPPKSRQTKPVVKKRPTSTTRTAPARKRLQK